MRINKVPVSYRLSNQVIRLIIEVAEHLGLSKTELIEELVIREAQKLNMLGTCNKCNHSNEQ